MAKPLTPADIAALNVIRQAMKDNFRRTFQGATFVPKGETIGGAIGDATDTVVEVVDTVCGEIAASKGYESFKKGFTAVAQPGPFVLEVLRKVTGMDSQAEILQAVGPATLTVKLRRLSGEALAGAAVRLEGHMTHPGMAPVLADATERTPGVYDLTFEFTMQGDWVLLVSAQTQHDGRIERRIDITNVRPAG